METPYEFTTLVIGRAVRIEDCEAKLNALGREGWMLAGIADRSSPMAEHSADLFVFQRKVVARR